MAFVLLRTLRGHSNFGPAQAEKKRGVEVHRFNSPREAPRLAHFSIHITSLLVPRTVAVGITILVSLSEVILVGVTITIPRVVILGRALEGAMTRRIVTS